MSLTLWTDAVRDLHVVIREDGLYTIGPERSEGKTRKLDPLTGKVLATYPGSRRACTRSTGGADGIFFRAPGGSVLLDLAAPRGRQISPMRPSCLVGVLIANGHAYWLPWTCDCNLQMFGVISCGPAGEFTFGRRAEGAERLEVSPNAGAVAPLPVAQGDWPTYRADSARSGRSAASVPERVRRVWQYTPAAAYEATSPVAAGGLVFVGGSDGIVRALDAATGKLRWRAYTGAAVRYPPTIAAGRALVASGDGWVYAFEAATGKRLWRFRAAPVERRIPVYGALQSTWPVATGVLVADGVAYLAAGMNNFDGTHAYALDAATGAIRWQNNASGHLDRVGRRGIAAQGHMLLHDGKLYLAGGNAVSPGIYDAASGKCLNRPPRGPGSRAPRGRELRLLDGRVRVGGQALYSTAAAPVYDRSVQWPPAVVTAANANLICRQVKDPDGPAWTLQATRGDTDKPLWVQPLPGPPVRWAVAIDAHGRIFVTLRDGRVVGFAAAKAAGKPAR